MNDLRIKASLGRNNIPKCNFIYNIKNKLNTKPTDFLENPIAFHPIYARIAKCALAGLFLSQAVYWTKIIKKEKKINWNDTKKMTKEKISHDEKERINKKIQMKRDGWFYKTKNEWEEETTLTRKNQETARKKLRSLGIIEEMKKGIPAKLYYRVNMERLNELIEQYAEAKILKASLWSEGWELVFNPNEISSLPDSSIQEITSVSSKFEPKIQGCPNGANTGCPNGANREDRFGPYNTETTRDYSEIESVSNARTMCEEKNFSSSNFPADRTFLLNKSSDFYESMKKDGSLKIISETLQIDETDHFLKKTLLKYVKFCIQKNSEPTTGIDSIGGFMACLEGALQMHENLHIRKKNYEDRMDMEQTRSDYNLFLEKKRSGHISDKLREKYSKNMPNFLHTSPPSDDMS